MNDIVKTKAASTSAPHEINQPFRGYTIEELRYQRAFIALKKDFSKAKLMRSLDALNGLNPLSSKNKSGIIPGKFGPLTSKLLTGISYFDYAKMGFMLFTTGRKVYSFFKKRK